MRLLPTLQQKENRKSQLYVSMSHWVSNFFPLLTVFVNYISSTFAATIIPMSTQQIKLPVQGVMCKYNIMLFLHSEVVDCFLASSTLPLPLSFSPCFPSLPGSLCIHHFSFSPCESLKLENQLTGGMINRPQQAITICVAILFTYIYVFIKATARHLLLIYTCMFGLRKY